MDAVVIIATVLAPILSLKIHAMMNGTKIPKPVVERPWIEAWIGRALRICPKAPPAPVMARIAALSVIPADTQERILLFLLWNHTDCKEYTDKESDYRLTKECKDICNSACCTEN